MSDVNPIAMAGVSGTAGPGSGNGAGGAALGNVGKPSSATAMGDVGGPIGQLDQVRSALQSLTSITGKINLAVVRDSDGQELWIDLLGPGASIPGHTMAFRFGEPPANVSTNPATFFAQGLVTSTPLGVPLWVWITGAAVLVFFVVPMLLKGKR